MPGSGSSACEQSPKAPVDWAADGRIESKLVQLKSAANSTTTNLNIGYQLCWLLKSTKKGGGIVRTGQPERMNN